MADSASPEEGLKLNQRLMLFMENRRVLIDPRQLEPLSAIRPVKAEGVEKLQKNMIMNGWSPTSFIFVRQCDPEETDEKKKMYGVMDGMHRATAAANLAKSTTKETSAWTNQKVNGSASLVDNACCVQFV